MIFTSDPCPWQFHLRRPCLGWKYYELSRLLTRNPVTPNTSSFVTTATSSCRSGPANPLLEDVRLKRDLSHTVAELTGSCTLVWSVSQRLQARVKRWQRRPLWQSRARNTVDVMLGRGSQHQKDSECLGNLAFSRVFFPS